MAEAIHYLETAAFIRECAAAIQNKFSGASRPASALFHQMQESKDLYNAAAWGYRGTVIGAVQNVADASRALKMPTRAGPRAISNVRCKCTVLSTFAFSGLPKFAREVMRGQMV